jgi:hypothetical protein
MKKLLILLTGLLLLCGCSTVIPDNVKADENTTDTHNLSFSSEELDGSYEINGSTYISLENEDVTIAKGGTYILDGTMENAGIIVAVDDSEDVQLVLNNVTIHSGNFAGIYIVSGDEILITLAEGSVNTISDSGTYTQIDSNNVDALIYSKSDLAIAGTGTLNLESSFNHGIVSKDDLIIAGGTYNISVAGQGLSGKDCLMIYDGSFNISCGKDALKSDNSEDEDRGYITIVGGDFVISSDADGIYAYRCISIEGGTFDITTVKSANADSYKAIKSDNLITISGGEIRIDSADDGVHSDNEIVISGGTIEIESDDDGIHADGKVQIDGGNITISAHEGIEATYVLINDGIISISASDDGINAAQKVKTYTATIEINGGYVTIVMGQGDTDGLDSNGYIYINGGTVDVTGMNTFDAEIAQEFNGGTVIVNGVEVDELPEDMMSGGFGGFPGFNGEKSGENNNGTPPGFNGEKPSEGSDGFAQPGFNRGEEGGFEQLPPDFPDDEEHHGHFPGGH